VVNSILSSPQEIIMENALSGAALRHKVISNNIANVNTPGFKRTAVSFEDRLTEALQQESSTLARTNSRHLPGRKTGGFSPLLSVDSNTTMRTDGNNVDIDAEMANLAKNNIYYDAVAQQLSRYFTNLKSVISGGSR
jgi:flagellar basal-body rod protein FlgB